MDLGDVAMISKDLHKFLIGMDIMSGLQGVMRPVEIHFLVEGVNGNVHWD